MTQKLNLPDPGENRWWKVELSKAESHRRKPMKVQLMECFSPGREAMSSVLALEYATANERDLVDAAEMILVRVAQYQDFVGSYGLKGSKQ